MEDPVVTAEAERGSSTLDGTLKGTIPYMSPEQARGEASSLDRRSDVYALGALLYEMLTLHPAFGDHGMETLAKVQLGEFTPVTDRNPRRPVPEALGELTMRAMALSPDDRPESAEAFEEELRAWLDGRSEADRRHREAEALAAKGKEAAARFEALKGEMREAEDRAEAMEEDFQSFQPLSEKRPLLEAPKRVKALETEFALAFAETVKYLEAALVAEEKNSAARRALAELWRGRLGDAEREGNEADTAYALEMIGRYDDGALAKVIFGEGTLTLCSEPAGAEAFLSHFTDQDGVLEPEEERSPERRTIEIQTSRGTRAFRGEETARSAILPAFEVQPHSLP